MKHVTGREIVNRIDRYLADPRLEPEALLRKRWAWIWMVVTFVWVLITAFLELVVLKAWPLWWVGAAFIVSYLAGFPVFRRSKRFDLVINIVFSIFIIVIFFAMLQIGGLTTSMGFVFIGMNCAMGSVLAGNLRWTVGTFILYCATILFAGILQPYLTTPDYITPSVNTISFVGLALWINACILFLVILFMKDKNRYEKAEAEKVRKIDEAKTLLYTNVSHEFRTPLTVIQGMAEQLEQNPDKWLQTGPGKIKVQSQVLLRLVNQIWGSPKKLSNISLNVFTRFLTNKFMSRINSLLDEQLQNEDFGIRDICSNLNMSRPQLYRKFTALTKWSVGRYIKSYRLHKAKEKIESQGKNVTEAAYESGFKNLSHFSTSFREEFGYPPSDLL